jgi:tetratricopeptide (TPR) repeat protein
MRFADALAELETAQVLVGTQFAHDLVFDAVLRSVPRAIAEHTHAEVARWLAQQNGEPARIARHWIAARRAEQALPWLEQAAQRARDALRNVEQLQFLDLRAEIEASLGQRAAAFETGLAALLVYADHEREATQCAQRCDVLEALADSDAQRIRVCIERANVATRRREMEQAESLARRALAAAQLSGETALVQRSQITLFEVLVTTLQNAEALSLGEACLGWISDASDREWRRNLHAALGVLYDNTGQLERALAQIAIARRACEGHPEEGNIAVLLGNEAALLVQAGKARQAWEQGQAALRLAAQLERVTSTGPELLTLANAAVLLGQYGSALHWADRAEQVLREAAPAGVAIAENYRATCHLHLGQRARALQCLQRIGDDPTAMLSARVRMHQLRCRLSREVGEATLPHVEAGLALLPEGARPNQRASLRIERALGLPGPQALVELQAVHDFAQRCGYTGHVLEARMHAARIAVTVSTALAREHALAALNLARQCEPVVSYRGELWLCCARAFEACGDVQRLRAVLTEAFDWIAATAEQQVPAEFRDSFLNRNPVNRDLRAWASRLDIAGSASTLARGG